MKVINNFLTKEEHKQLEKDRAEYILTPESDRKIIEDAAININKLNQQIKQVNEESDINSDDIIGYEDINILVSSLLGL